MSIFDEPEAGEEGNEDKTNKDDEKTAELRTLAKQFAALIPDQEFSPADLQDYLLVHKKDATAAVAELPVPVPRPSRRETPCDP